MQSLFVSIILVYFELQIYYHTKKTVMKLTTQQRDICNLIKLTDRPKYRLTNVAISITMGLPLCVVDGVLEELIKFKLIQQRGTFYKDPYYSFNIKFLSKIN